MYRRTRAEMPANSEEIEGAEEEGVQLMFLAAPKKVVLDEKGRARGIEYLRMELGEPDASGRRRPEPIEGSEAVEPADFIIAAIGQRPDLDCLYGEGQACPIESTRWRTIAADSDTLQTTVPNVFSGGDVYTGPDLVISAVGAGRKAARSIHYYLTEGAIPVADDVQRELIPYTLFTDVKDVEPGARPGMPHACKLDDRSCTFLEVEGVLTEEEALKETGRCLRCGLTCYDRSGNPDVALEQLTRG